MSARDLRLLATVAAEEVVAGLTLRWGKREVQRHLRRAFLLLLRDVRRQVRQEVRKERGR